MNFFGLSIIAIVFLLEGSNGENRPSNFQINEGKTYRADQVDVIPDKSKRNIKNDDCSGRISRKCARTGCKKVCRQKPNFINQCTPVKKCRYERCTSCYHATHLECDTGGKCHVVCGQKCFVKSYPILINRKKAQ
uniref:Uncharacterized protein n=1 Tax=Clytia hemisphaerica TaxID=252671 RepID=A0A7M5V0Z7_9CNID